MHECSRYHLSIEFHLVTAVKWWKLNHGKLLQLSVMYFLVHFVSTTSDLIMNFWRTMITKTSFSKCRDRVFKKPLCEMFKHVIHTNGKLRLITVGNPGLWINEFVSKCGTICPLVWRHSLSGAPWSTTYTRKRETALRVKKALIGQKQTWDLKNADWSNEY